MRRPRVVVSILRRTDVWATPLWTQPRLRWLRTLGLPCTTPRESLRPANRPTWPRAGAAATSRVCRAVQLAASRRRVPPPRLRRRARIRAAKTTSFWPFPIHWPSRPPPLRNPPPSQVLLRSSPYSSPSPPPKPLPSPCAARGRRRCLAASRGGRTTPAPPPVATGAVPASSDLAPTSNTPR
jgi:hypothetical protein